MASPTLIHLPHPIPHPPKNPNTAAAASSVAVWTSSIAALARRGLLHLAASSFSLMLSSPHCHPNHITLLTLLSACSTAAATTTSSSSSSASAALSLGLSLHSLILKQYHLSLPDHPILLLNTALVQFYSKFGRSHLARQVFDRMSLRNSFTFNAMIAGHMNNAEVDLALSTFLQMPSEERDKISWTALIDGFVKNGQFEEALLHFREMQVQESQPIEPDYVMILALVAACADLGTLGQGMWVHRFAMSRGRNLCREIRVVNSFIDMYSRCGRVDLAHQVFVGVENSRRTRVTWNSMIVGFAVNGCSNEALDHFDMMQKMGFEPDGVSFTGALTACSHAGLVDEGMKYYNLMKMRYTKIPLRIEHYGCVVDMLGRAGRLEEAMSVIESMMPVMGPNEVVLSSLLAACRMHGNVGLAEKLVGYLVEIEPETDSNFVMLSNIYAAVGRWAGAGEVRKAMKSLGIKKSPGYSAVEIDGALHEFVAGDKGHTESDEISGMLKLLSCEMKLLHCSSDEFEVQTFESG